MIEIKSNIDGKVLFKSEKAIGVKEALLEALKKKADLSSADLRFADLNSANLSSANLRSADLRSANLSSANLNSANLNSAKGSFIFNFGVKLKVTK